MSNPEKTIDWETVKPDVQKVKLKLSLPPELYNQLKFRGFDLDLMSATVEKALASFLVNADESEASVDQNRQIYTCEDYDKLIEINPNDYKAWYGRGVVLKNLGSYEEAIASLDKALQIKSDYHKAWYARGNALYGLDFYEEAIVSYDKAIEFKPNYAEAWYYRGKALYELGCDDEAKASYEKANISSQNQDTRKTKAEKLLEQANQQLGEALKSYQQALDVYQDIGEDTVATLIAYILSESKIVTVTTTDESGDSKIKLTAANGIIADSSRVKRRKSRKS